MDRHSQEEVDDIAFLSYNGEKWKAIAPLKTVRLLELLLNSIQESFITKFQLVTYASGEERFNHYDLWAANLWSKKIVFGMITLEKKERESTIKSLTFLKRIMKAL
jgi:hypothetical protein